MLLGKLFGQMFLLKDRDIPWNTTQCIKIIDQTCYLKQMAGVKVER